jgi:hypothetical protein
VPDASRFGENELKTPFYCFAVARQQTIRQVIKIPLVEILQFSEPDIAVHPSLLRTRYQKACPRIRLTGIDSQEYRHLDRITAASYNPDWRSRCDTPIVGATERDQTQSEEEIPMSMNVELCTRTERRQPA